MDRDAFWALIDEARAGAADGQAIADRAAALLAVRPRDDILAFDRILWEVMDESYREALWGAAYLINGGCSDDGFDYFRGWLIGQGRATFESAVAGPDALAEVPDVRSAAEQLIDLDNEGMLSIAWNAYRSAFGEDIPHVPRTGPHPDPGPGWDFDDMGETRRQLPRLSALYDVHYAE